MEEKRKKRKEKGNKRGKNFLKKRRERERRTAPNEICHTTIPPLSHHDEYIVFVWVAYDCQSDVVNAS